MTRTKKNGLSDSAVPVRAFFTTCGTCAPSQQPAEGRERWLRDDGAATAREDAQMESKPKAKEAFSTVR